MRRTKEIFLYKNILIQPSEYKNQKPDKKPDPGPPGKFHVQMSLYDKRNFPTD